MAEMDIILILSKMFLDVFNQRMYFQPPIEVYFSSHSVSHTN